MSTNDPRTSSNNVRHMNRTERESTPPAFAEWLVAVARAVR